MTNFVHNLLLYASHGKYMCFMGSNSNKVHFMVKLNEQPGVGIHNIIHGKTSHIYITVQKCLFSQVVYFVCALIRKHEFNFVKCTVCLLSFYDQIHNNKEILTFTFMCSNCLTEFYVTFRGYKALQGTSIVSQSVKLQNQCSSI